MSAKDPTLPGAPDEGVLAKEQLESIRDFFGLPEEDSVSRGLRTIWPRLVAAQERYVMVAQKLDRILLAAKKCGEKCPCPLHVVIGVEL